MPTRRALYACALTLALAWTHAAGQAPPPAVGTGAITGSVLAADSGRPLSRAIVTLNDAASRPVATTVSDAQGHFALSNVPPGSFTLKSVHTGFLDVIYGQKQPGSGRPGSAIQLADGQRLENLKLVMARGSVISGTVTDETGGPAFGVTVRAFKWDSREGERAVLANASARTDDRGYYRIALLPPGDYLVGAMAVDELVTAEANAQGLRAVQDRIRAASADRAAVMGPPFPMPAKPKDSYVPVYFPSTLQMTAATTIALGIGQERSATDIQLQIVPIATVSGAVSWNGGALPVGNSAADTVVILTDKTSVVGGNGGSKIFHATAGGRFSFDAVPAGEYSLVASAMAGANELSGGNDLWASTDLVITGAPIADVALSLERGFPVSGTVVATGTALDVSRVTLYASPAGPSGVAERVGSSARPDAAGRFTLANVVPGRYRIAVRSGLSGGAVLKSSVFGGRDSLDFPIEVKSGEPVPEGVLTIVPRLSEIGGEVRDSSGQVVIGSTVIVFASDERFWTPHSRRIQAVRPASDGKFSAKNLPSGDYRVIAVSDVAQEQWYDQGFLRSLLPLATPVSLVEGERRDQALRLVR
jgi:hypothetical protein